MGAHRYWKLGDLNTPSPPGNALSMAECYLRATVGGSNFAPVAAVSSTNFDGSTTVAKCYDGNAATLWGSASGDTTGSAYVAFDYGSAVDPGALFVQARNDSSPFYQQTPTTINIYWSDTGLSGPWTLAFTVTPAAWTSLGQTQEFDLKVPTPDIRVQKVASLVVALAPAVGVEVQKVAALPVAVRSPPIVVQKSTALVVGLGRVANPHVRPWTFTMDGHDFLVIRTFSMTLIHDFENGQWYTWGIGDNDVWPLQVGMNWNADLGAVFPDFGGQNQTTVVCGDDTFDTIYFLDPELVDDMTYDGSTGQKFQRCITGQIAMRGHDYVSCPMVELTGSNGDSLVGTDLTVRLNISDDRGYTYWNAGTQSVIVGEHDVTLAWSGLGSFTGPGRLFRFYDYGAVYRVDGLDMVDGQ